MKTLSPFSAIVFFLLVVIMMVMMAQASDSFGETSTNPHLPLAEYNGMLYYIHKDYFIDFELAQKSCAADNGMLVEINDWSEFYVIEKYIESAASQDVSFSTFIGAKYRLGDYQWVLPSTGEPLTVTRLKYDLEKDSPELRFHYYCLVLKSTLTPTKNARFSSVMDPQPCTSYSPQGKSTVRYMCEKINAAYYPNQLPNADPNIRAVEGRGKVYYIHKKTNSGFHANVRACKADGGMMAEINDYLEFLLVQNYLKSTLGSRGIVFIGGKKIGKRWVLPSTNQPLPYVKWGHKEPGFFYDWMDQCLILVGHKGWEMGADAFIRTGKNRVLCEKPKDS